MNESMIAVQSNKTTSKIDTFLLFGYFQESDIQAGYIKNILSKKNINRGVFLISSDCQSVKFITDTSSQDYDILFENYFKESEEKMIDPVKQIIIVRKDLLTREENRMTPGKLAAQVAHASLGPLLEIARGKSYEDIEPRKGPYSLILNLTDDKPLKEWLEKDFRKIVLYVKTEKKLLEIYNELKEAGFIVTLIKDKGLTVFEEPTVTCLGVEPLPHSVISPFVKRLQLLN